MGILKQIGKTAGNVVTGSVNSISGQAMGALGARIFGGKAGYDSYIASLYQSGLTGEQREIQALEDSRYQRTVQDMQAAGINPAAAGQMSGDGAVSPSNQAQVPNEDLLSGLNKLQQNKLIKAQEKAQAIQNVYALEKEYQTLQGLIKDNEQKGIDVSESRIRLQVLSNTIDEQIESYGLMNAKTRADIRKTNAEAEEQEKRNRYVEHLLSIEVMEGQTRIDQMLENIELLKSTVREKDSITALNDFELEFKKATKELQEEYLKAQIALTKASKAFQDSQSAVNKQNLNEAIATFQDRALTILEGRKQAQERTAQEGQHTLQEIEHTRQAEKDTKFYEANRNWDHILKITDSALKATGIAVGAATGANAAGKAAQAAKAAGQAAKNTANSGSSTSGSYEYGFDKNGNIYIK